jgi:hypothetical protein
MLTNDSVGSNRALKWYSRHRRQRNDCCYKRAAERRSLSRPCRPSKYLAGLTCSDPGTAPKSMAPRGDVWPTQPDRLMQELEGTEALRALRCERFLSSSPFPLPLVLTQSPAECPRSQRPSLGSKKSSQLVRATSHSPCVRMLSANQHTLHARHNLVCGYHSRSRVKPEATRSS